MFRSFHRGQTVYWQRLEKQSQLVKISNTTSVKFSDVFFPVKRRRINLYIIQCFVGFSVKHQGSFTQANLIHNSNKKTYLQSCQMLANSLKISVWDVSNSLYLENVPTRFLGIYWELTTRNSAEISCGIIDLYLGCFLMFGGRAHLIDDESGESVHVWWICWFSWC